MRRARLLPLLALVAALSAVPAQAIGFGRAVDNTRLGQSLNFAAFVRLEAGESIARECVFADVTVGERRLPAGLLRVTLEPGADANERVVRVTSRELIDEPVVTVDVSVGCNGRLSRSFVNFVDPPALNLAQSQPAEALAPQRSDPQLSPVLEATGQVPAAAATAPAAAAAPPAAVAPPAAPRRARVAAAAASVPATPPAPRAARPTDTPRQQRAAARPPSEPGPRLKLDPAPLLAAAKPATPPPAPAEPAASAAVGAQGAAASAAISVDLLAAQMAAEQQQRLAAMEDSLRRLRAEAQATQGELASVKAQLAQAETGRYANPLVYLLAIATLLLAAALVLLWRRQRQGPVQPSWWSPDGVPRSAPAALPVQAEPDDEDSRLSPGTLPAARAASPSEIGPLPPPVPVAPPPREAPPPPRRELSVEELIDLEQQADFFIVLGQDEAAIDLLMGHVRNTGGGSPLPYLKLLEIYARRGEPEAYERVRERFNRRFNAYAPDWGANLQHGRALEDYPEVVAQLQTAWREPALAMRTMETLLFRRDEEAQTFELPAYRELLFLYSIARDLMQEEGEGVDLALPIGAAPAVSAPMPFSDPRHEDTLPLLTSVPEAYKQTSVMQYPVDIDLSDPPPPAEPTVTRISFDGLIDSDGRSRGSGSY